LQKAARGIAGIDVQPVPTLAAGCKPPAVQKEPASALARLWRGRLRNIGQDDDEETPLAVLEVREAIESSSDFDRADMRQEIAAHRPAVASWARQALASLVRSHEAALIEAIAAEAIESAWSRSVGADSSDLDLAFVAVDAAQALLDSICNSDS